MNIETSPTCMNGYIHDSVSSNGIIIYTAEEGIDMALRAQALGMQTTINFYRMSNHELYKYHIGLKKIICPDDMKKMTYEKLLNGKENALRTLS